MPPIQVIRRQPVIERQDPKAAALASGVKSATDSLAQGLNRVGEMKFQEARDDKVIKARDERLKKIEANKSLSEREDLRRDNLKNLTDAIAKGWVPNQVALQTMVDSHKSSFNDIYGQNPSLLSEPDAVLNFHAQHSKKTASDKIDKEIKDIIGFINAKDPDVDAIKRSRQALAEKHGPEAAIQFDNALRLDPSLSTKILDKVGQFQPPAEAEPEAPAAEAPVVNRPPDLSGLAQGLVPSPGPGVVAAHTPETSPPTGQNPRNPFGVTGIPPAAPQLDEIPPWYRALKSREQEVAKIFGPEIVKKIDELRGLGWSFERILQALRETMPQVADQIDTFSATAGQLQ
jgi:hypothetical protein